MITKQLIEIEIPIGWKAIAYRVPMIGEWILDNDGVIKNITAQTKDKEIIVVRAWSTPSWFPRKGYLFKATQGWLISLLEPTFVPTVNLYSINGWGVPADRLAELYGQTFTPPNDILITDLI